MTVYVVEAEAGGTVIQAGINDIRIIGVEIVNFSGAGDNGWLYVITGASSINGTARTPLPAKVGAPATTASVKVAPGDGVTGGVSKVIGMYTMNGSSTTFGNAVWQPMGDIIIPSGTVFRVGGDASAEAVWYEELRLSWSY